jgi:hypothetical protein
MNSIQQEWKRAADELGFKIQTPFALTLPSGNSIEAELLISDFGGEKGLLIFTDYEKIKPFVGELRLNGFHCSIIGESSSNQEFEIESFIDCLSDWGWSGAEADRPVWLREPPEYEPPE